MRWPSELGEGHLSHFWPTNPCQSETKTDSPLTGRQILVSQQGSCGRVHRTRPSYPASPPAGYQGERATGSHNNTRSSFVWKVNRILPELWEPFTTNCRCAISSWMLVIVSTPQSTVSQTNRGRFTSLVLGSIATAMAALLLKNSYYSDNWEEVGLT